MPGRLTEITEIATALGMLAPTLESALADRPRQLVSVNDDVWEALRDAYESGQHTADFRAAFDNGRAFFLADDGLRGRVPLRAEWKGPDRPPGDDVIPADLRVDHVFLVSCKYLSKIMLNPSPQRLFDRLLVGDARSSINWFADTAPHRFQELYAATRAEFGLVHLPSLVTDLTRADQRVLKAELAPRRWPASLEPLWELLCTDVAVESSRRWRAAMRQPQDQLRLLWRMLRITTATYFVLGADRDNHLRIRVHSSWDWMKAYELVTFGVAPKHAGQPEVLWRAGVRSRIDGSESTIKGHIEVRWAHGRFVGSPEAKVYLDTPHHEVPGYNPL